MLKKFFMIKKKYRYIGAAVLLVIVGLICVLIFYEGPDPDASTISQGEVTATDANPQGEAPSTGADPQGQAPATGADPQGETPATDADPQGQAPATDASPQGEAPATDTIPQWDTPTTDAIGQWDTPATDTIPQWDTPTTGATPQGEAPVTGATPQSEAPTTDAIPQGAAPSAETIIVPAGETSFSIGLGINEDKSFAGIEFALTLSDVNALTFASFSPGFAGAIASPFMEKNGLYYFGFYTSTNAFPAGDALAGTLRFTGYTSNQALTVTVVQMSVIRLDANNKTSKAEKESPAYVFTVKR